MPTQLGQTLLIPAKGASGWVMGMQPFNNIVTAIGDSITIASAAGSGGKIAFSSTYSQYQAQSFGSNGGGYLTMAVILPKTGDTFSNGPLLWGGVHATGGLTTAQIESTHLDGSDSPFNDTPLAGTCIICAGQNDAAAMSSQSAIDTRVNGVISMCRKLAARGIMPVVVGVPGNNTNSTNVLNFNTSLATAVVAAGFHHVNPGTYEVDGTYKANMHKGDGIHPSLLGAVTMGQALRDKIEPLLSSNRPTLVTTATETDSWLQWLNGCFQLVGGTAGVPRGGAPPAEDTNPWTWTAATATPTLQSRTNYSGQSMKINKAASVADTTIQSTGGAGVPPQLADGSNIVFGFIAEVESWAAENKLDLELYATGSATKKLGRLKLASDSTYTTAVKPFVWWQTNTIVAGMSFGTNGRINGTWGRDTGSGDRAITAHWGQLTVGIA